MKGERTYNKPGVFRVAQEKERDACFASQKVVVAVVQIKPSLQPHCSGVHQGIE